MKKQLILMLILTNLGISTGFAYDHSCTLGQKCVLDPSLSENGVATRMQFPLPHTTGKFSCELDTTSPTAKITISMHYTNSLMSPVYLQLTNGVSREITVTSNQLPHDLTQNLLDFYSLENATGTKDTPFSGTVECKFLYSY